MALWLGTKAGFIGANDDGGGVPLDGGTKKPPVGGANMVGVPAVCGSVMAIGGGAVTEGGRAFATLPPVLNRSRPPPLRLMLGPL